MGWSGATPVLSWKDSARVATAAALPAVTYDNGTAGVGATLTANAVGVLTVDGVATVLGDRILVKNQVAGLQNGPYDVTTEGTAGVAAVLTRSPLSDEAAEIPNEAVFAQEGTANSDSGFTQTADEPITMGTTALVYVQFTGLGMVTAGTGMTKTGNTLNVIGGTGITANADDIEIDATVVTLDGAQTLTNKTLTAPDINGGTADSLTALSVRSTGAAFDLTLASATVFTAGRTLTIDPGDAARTLTLSGNPTLDDWFDQDVKTTANPTFVNLTITSFAADWTNAGRTVADLGIVTTVDINGGTIDGVTLGTSGIDLSSNTLTGTKAEFITACSDGTFVFTANDLSVFAATTSAQLAGVISDETGTGLLVFGTNATLVTPTIASFANAAHDHSDAAGGAKLTNTALTSGVFAAITGIGTQAQVLDMNTNKISNLADGTLSTDAATKGQVDVATAGIHSKLPVRVATAAALPANTAAGSKVGKTLTADAVGVLTVDGIATVLGDRILVSNEVAGADNGIYEVTTEGTAGVAYILTRAEDADEDAEVLANMYTWVNEGTANADSSWSLTTDNPITVDTTALVFGLFTQLGDIVAGTGMTKTADTINVIGGTGIDANANDIAIDATVATLTGSQTLTNKTLTTPTIGDFTSAGHDHEDAAGGGTLALAAISGLPGTIAAILTDHDRAAHDALGTGDVVYEDETQTLTGKTYRGPNGSSGSVTYGFTSYPNSGMYQDGALLYVKANGGAWMKLSTGVEFNKAIGAYGFNVTSGVIKARDGTVGSPAIQFVGDGDTGTYHPSADALGLVTGGGLRLYIYNGGAITYGDAKVTGNLIVEGTTTTVDSETVMVADNHLYLNSGYVTDAAQTGGLVVNYDPTTTTDTVDGGGFGFIAGEVGVSNPIIQTVGSATFSVGDFIDISGTADDPNNDGLFEVLSHVGTTLTLRGVGLTATVEDFTQNQLNTGDVLGSITKVAVSVLRAGTDGAWESAAGSSTGLSFDNVVGLAATQALSNKTYDLSSNTLTGTIAEFNTALSDGTFVVTANDLSVFAATTSAQLAGVLSDETGTGVFVLADGPTMTSVRIAGTTSTSFLELDDGVATAAAAAGEARLFYNDTAKTIQERHDAGGSNTMARIATGSYTGDGTTSQAITGVGFQPIFVKIWPRETVDETASGSFETTPEMMDDNAAGMCFHHGSGGTPHRFLDNAIISLDADGFTVDDDGVDGPPNSNGVVYNWMAIG